MACPRVFISSTCYDLAEERDGLAEFCSTFGFDTTLSERGDVFYHPDLHTHTSCVRETSNCHLFILVIGGRFGGKYKVDTSKSITNAEYAAAVQSGSPVFAFVKQDVLNDHNVWQRNRNFAFAKDIHFPSIEKQEHAEDIFKFIDTVRLAPTNNGMFGFRLAKDIHEILRKQWAGLMFEYLQNRTLARQLSLTNDALGNLSVVSAKIEELVKNIYRNVDVNGAATAIENIEQESAADEFLHNLSALMDDQKFISKNLFETAEEMPENWWEFVTHFGWGSIVEKEAPDGNAATYLTDLIDTPVQIISGKMNKAEKTRMDRFISGYAKFCSLPKETQIRLVDEFLFVNEEPTSETE
jgi:hypothetical protein